MQTWESFLDSDPGDSDGGYCDTKAGIGGLDHHIFYSPEDHSAFFWSVADRFYLSNWCLAEETLDEDLAFLWLLDGKEGIPKVYDSSRLTKVRFVVPSSP